MTYPHSSKKPFSFTGENTRKIALSAFYADVPLPEPAKPIIDKVGAVALPIPDAPPVTSVTLPVSCPALVTSPSYLNCTAGHDHPIGYILDEPPAFCAPILYAIL
jgi:hypothetical protein